MCADVADVWRPARKAVETAINEVIERKDYFLPVDAWHCIGVVRDDEVFDERIRFLKKKRDMDFRLRIQHSAFKAATQHEREKMIFEMLLRSLEILRSKAGEAAGFDILVADLRGVASSKGWGSS